MKINTILVNYIFHFESFPEKVSQDLDVEFVI